MDADSLELFSAMDELEAAIKSRCLHSSTHSREAAWLIMDVLNNARYLLIHGTKGAPNALPD
ncbi:hypothetical protein GL267_008630 [Acidithiobacillus ferrianus]|uniref:Uncharacterized protein n=2 Tax=Acidithiobacillus ferrianus TaxID=2678518 RepID=A0A845UDS3_9PROT|nr:hypothetical protein [Acidithiobacillus ferrianus]NDU43495.1 hypothetical protein [Acidithiobacillus ferrianus]